MTALNERRATFVDRSVDRATPGAGQEAIAFLDLDEAIRLEHLRIYIARLERAIEAVGCPL